MSETGAAGRVASGRPDAYPEPGELAGAGELACVWLGQAGFLLGAAGTGWVAVDPYLSDEVARTRPELGLVRRFPPPVAAERLRPTAVLVSHPHDDHCDGPTLATWARGGAVLAGSPGSIRAARAWGWPADRAHPLAPGDRVGLGPVTVQAVLARHGDLGPDALGFRVAVGGWCVYHCGDTEYDWRVARSAGPGIDLALLCVNGTGGNLDAEEAALLAGRLDARVVAPMHYGLWPDEAYAYGRQDQRDRLTPDPRRFLAALGARPAALGPVPAAVLLEPGRPVALRRRGGRVEVRVVGTGTADPGGAW